MACQGAPKPRQHLCSERQNQQIWKKLGEDTVCTLLPKTIFFHLEEALLHYSKPETLKPLTKDI